jgi:hypothetical protein
MNATGSEKWRSLPGMTIVDGCVHRAGSGPLILSVDELFHQDESHAILAYLTPSGFSTISVPWTACSVSLQREGTETKAVYLGESGEIVIFDGTGFVSGSPVPVDDDAGPLREVRSIAHNFFVAVGTGLQAYCTEDMVRWRLIEPWKAMPAALRAEFGLESIAGFSAQDLYAVGWDGLLCRSDGHSWRQVPSPTNLDLYRVHCASDGAVYACGDEGILLQGRGDIWSVIEQDITTEKLWGLSYFDGRLIVSSMNFLYECDAEGFRQIVSPEEYAFPDSTYRLDSNANVLWSIGTKQLFEYEKSDWSRLLSMYE